MKKWKILQDIYMIPAVSLDFDLKLHYEIPFDDWVWPDSSAQI